MKSPLFFALCYLSLLSFAQGQSNLTIDDREQLLTAPIREALAAKFSEIGIEVTSIVDFNAKCDYLFGSITKIDNQLSLKIKDCDDKLLGEQKVGGSILEASVEEQAIIYFYNFRTIIDNPNSNEVSSTTSSEEIIENEGPVEVEHDSRYFFSPTAYNLKKGEFYYNTLYFFLHDIQVGLSDQFSIGLGSTIIGIPMYLNAKVSFELGEKTQLAIGDLPIIGTYDVDFFGNLAYATLTRGNKQTNISFSLGALNTTDNDITGETFSLVYNIGGMARASDYIFFVTENYFLGYNTTEYAYFYTDDWVSTFEEKFTVTDYALFGISGVRIVRKNNELASWQFGLAYLYQIFGETPARYNQPGWETYRYGDNNLIAFPMFSYTKKFRLD